MSWNPRPDTDDLTRRKAYHAGYSDGFHGYQFGAGDLEPGADYRRGYDDGCADAARKIEAPLP